MTSSLQASIRLRAGCVLVATCARLRVRRHDVVGARNAAAPISANKGDRYIQMKVKLTRSRNWA